MKSIRLICALLALTLAANLAYGEAVNGSSVGTVPNSKVTIAEASTGVSRVSNTPDNGNKQGG